MSHEQLERDWRTDPRLTDASYDDVAELADFLRRSHEYLMGEGSGPLGYLYRLQVMRVRELKEKLNERK